MGAKHRQWVQIGMDRRKCGRRLFGPALRKFRERGLLLEGLGGCFFWGSEDVETLEILCLSGDLLIKQRRNDAWADERSVQAAADALKREIVVLKQSDGACSIYSGTMVHFRPLQSEGRPPINIRPHLDHFGQLRDVRVYSASDSMDRAACEIGGLDGRDWHLHFGTSPESVQGFIEPWMGEGFEQMGEEQSKPPGIVATGLLWRSSSYRETTIDLFREACLVAYLGFAART